MADDVIRRRLNMGYESRIFVVNKAQLGDEKPWGEIIASMNLCCVDNEVLRGINEYPETDCYIFADGEERTSEDKYGQTMREIPIPDLIGILEQAEANDHYRRYSPCIGLLKGFCLSDWDDGLVCLHYGY